MFATIRKRNGNVVDFQPEKITRAIFKAATAVGGHDWETAEILTSEIVMLAETQFSADIIDVEFIQDLVNQGYEYLPIQRFSL